MKSVFEYRSPWSKEEYQLILYKRRYGYTGRLAVTAETVKHEPFTNITTCIPNCDLSSDDEALAFLDTNNNPGIDKWLVANKIAVPTGKVVESGYCKYPEFRFNLDLLEE